MAHIVKHDSILFLHAKQCLFPLTLLHTQYLYSLLRQQDLALGQDTFKKHQIKNQSQHRLQFSNIQFTDPLIPGSHVNCQVI